MSRTKTKDKLVGGATTQHAQPRLRAARRDGAWVLEVDGPTATLSLLFHPDHQRVGQCAQLTALVGGDPVELSRMSPLFGHPGEKPSTALADSFMSRRPAVLRPLPDDAVELDASGCGTALRVDGQPCQDRVVLTRGEVARGVVIELAERVTLLLHLARAETSPARYGLVGDSEAIVDLRRDIAQVADLDVPVLLHGESGTGKELVASAIHAASRRANGPCISVNMATIPASTAASELFGHTRGAFTGANQDQPGLFGSADGGTLFLDEIGETSAEVQAMLLRVLETGLARRVGSASVRGVDVRLVTATDMDLDKACDEGRFRMPLLHRIAGYQINVPPLRERREDIGRLLMHFLVQELDTVGEMRRLDEWSLAPFVASLARHSWPGNVRQLRNVVRQLVISNRGREELSIDATLTKMLDEPREPAPAAPDTGAGYRKPGEVAEDELLQVLRDNRFRLGPSAKALGVSKTSLYAMIDRSDRIRRATDLERDELLACHASCGGNLDEMAEKLEVSKRALQFRLKDLSIG